MFWNLPQPIQTWNNAHNEKPAHGRWFDLFFDLLFVGVAFNVGHLILHLLHDQHSLIHALTKSLAVFFVLFSAWLNNVQYYARFDVNDTLHKILDVIEFTSVGVAAFHGGSIANHHGSTYQATGMACGMWVAASVSTFRSAELTRSSSTNAKTQAMSFLYLNAFTLTLVAIALGVGMEDGQTLKALWPGVSSIGSTAEVVLGVLVLSAAVPVVALFGRVLCRSKQWQQSTVPVHISFLCHRVGEFEMLMLGESVLTCVTLQPPSSFENMQFHRSAIAAFAITTALMYQGYSAATFHPESHVMRRSALGGVVWLNNTWAHSFALILVGVGLKLAMLRGAARMTLNESCLLSGALVASFLFAQLTEFLHTLDGRPNGDSTWSSIAKHCLGRPWLMVLELGAVVAQAAVPMVSLSHAWSAYDEVLVSAGITLFASALQMYDPNAHALAGRFHEGHEGHEGHENHREHEEHEHHEHHE